MHKHHDQFRHGTTTGADTLPPATRLLHSLPRADAPPHCHSRSECHERNAVLEAAVAGASQHGLDQQVGGARVVDVAGHVACKG